ncbi:MAG TPA: glycosyltransferase [Xanthobacteraceae bacterium]|nr:glycosyltransferase [Xanthobacteraceae bacterium]
MNQRLTVLFTNIALSVPAGSEVVLRDLAHGLLRRGHRPIVYSPTGGDFAEEIAARGVPVINDLRRLREKPNIIHGQHSIPCGEALIQFPDVPAIFVCHAFNHWVEAPIHFPQIGLYVAVDEACRDRLVHAEGIDPNNVVTLHNAVDLLRIPPRPEPLKKPPQRALAFGKAASVPELWTACEKLGLELDAIGGSKGGIHKFPEQELVKYDVVFASARAALEAMCCGCAVIACDFRGLAGAVTTENFEPLRTKNFGLRSLVHPITAERLIEEILRYDPDDAARVSARARKEADLEKLLDRFEQLYNEVLNGRRKPSITAAARKTAEARFLHENLPRRPDDRRWPWLAEREKFQRDSERLAKNVEVAKVRLTAVQAKLDDKNRNLDRVRLERDKANREIIALNAQVAALNAQVAALNAQVAALTGEVTTLSAIVSSVPRLLGHLWKLTTGRSRRL